MQLIVKAQTNLTFVRASGKCNNCSGANHSRLWSKNHNTAKKFGGKSSVEACSLPRWQRVEIDVISKCFSRASCGGSNSISKTSNKNNMSSIPGSTLPALSAIPTDEIVLGMPSSSVFKIPDIRPFLPWVPTDSAPASGPATDGKVWIVWDLPCPGRLERRPVSWRCGRPTGWSSSIGPGATTRPPWCIYMFSGLVSVCGSEQNPKSFESWKKLNKKKPRHEWRELVRNFRPFIFFHKIFSGPRKQKTCSNSFLVSRPIDLLSKVDRSKADGHPIYMHALTPFLVSRPIDLLSKVDRSKADGHPNIHACSNSIPCVKTDRPSIEGR